MASSPAFDTSCVGGTSHHRAPYATIPTPPTTARITNATRTITGSMFRYSARPLATPAIILSSVRRCRRLPCRGGGEPPAGGSWWSVDVSRPSGDSSISASRPSVDSSIAVSMLVPVGCAHIGDPPERTLSRNWGRSRMLCGTPCGTIRPGRRPSRRTARMSHPAPGDRMARTESGSAAGHAAPRGRVVRSRSDRILAGVAGGLAARLGVDAVVVRLAFVVLAFAGGVGVAAYLLAWLFSVEPPPSDGSRGPDAGGEVAEASAVIWTRADRDARARWSRAASELPRRSIMPFLSGPASALRVALGGMLILGGMAVFLVANDAFAVRALRNVLFAAGVTVAGAALILGPGVWRLGRQLAAERRERIRSQERAEVAAHLHDSVLQSLAMIQRASSADEMATLARAQERELRAWLYAGGPAPGGTLRGAVQETADRVEDMHHVEVGVDQVGDADLDERGQALVQAAAEAMANAARHASVRRVSVYVEVEPDAVTAFVRDRGRGFDPGAVPPDRRGLAESVRGRMERAGGAAEVRSSPGEGTEVVLHMPRATP